MGRLDKDQDLLQGILEVCRKYSVRCAEIRALGALREVEIAVYDQRRKDYLTSKKFAGDLEILNATGNVSERDGDLFCHLHVTLSRDTDNGLEVLGGHLVSGKVFACEFTLSTCDDLILRRLPDKATGLALWGDAIQLQEEPGQESEGESWQDVLSQAVEPDGAEQPSSEPEESEREAAPPDPEELQPDEAAQDLGAEWPEPEVGDWVLHPKFGRCVVERVEEGAYIQVRLPNRRLVRLGLEVVKLKLVGYEADRQVFEAILPRPGRP